MTVERKRQERTRVAQFEFPTKMSFFNEWVRLNGTETHSRPRIGHFRITFSLFLKASLSAQISHENEKDSHVNLTYFHMNGGTPGLALLERLFFSLLYLRLAFVMALRQSKETAMSF